MASQHSDIPAAQPKKLKLRSRGGCINCRLRKRKCDESRPLCGHCQKLDYQCQYPSESSIQEQQQSLRQPQRQRMKMPISFAAPSDPHHTSSAEIIPRSRIANHEDIKISFLLHHMFKGANTFIQAGISGSTLTVRTELQFASDETSLTYNCLKGMAMVYWGVVNNNRAILSQGYLVRGEGLARMRSRLTSKIDASSGDLVAAIALMRLSDTIMPRVGSQWMIHAEALTHLCHALGPEVFQEPRMRCLLENNRWVMIAASSVKRKRIIFNEDAWKVIPWQNTHKDMVQTLLDVYARLPTLRALYDEGQSTTMKEAARLSRQEIFKTELHDILSELQQWRESVNEELLDSVGTWDFDASTSTVLPLDSDQPQLSFSSLHHSYAIALFNMLVIILGQYLDMISKTELTPEVFYKKPKSPQTLLTPLELPLEKPLRRAAVAADEMARIIPWIMQEKHKCAGALYISSPAVVCDQFWQRFSTNRSVWFATIVSQVNSVWESLVLRNPSQENELLRIRL